MFSTSPIRLVQRSLWVVLAIACVATPLIAQETGNCTVHDASSRPDCPEAIAFFQRMRAAVNAGDKSKLAAMVSYPMRTTQNGKRLQIRTRQQFLHQYPKLFNADVICAIESAKDSDVWGNYQGFMVGSGVIWWDSVIPASVKNPQPDSGKYPFKIIAINSQNVVASGCAGAK